MKSQALVISNLGPGEQMFDSDRGSWNVSRALRDCLAGKHGLFDFDVAGAVEASINVDVDEAKIAAMAADQVRLASSPPPIFVVDGHTDDGREMIWLIDGHHRLRALQRLGFKQFAGFVIEQKDAEAYRVLYNGDRIAPWIRNPQWVG